MDLFWILIIFLNAILMIMFYGLAQFFRRILYKNETVPPTTFNPLESARRRQNSSSSLSTISSQIANNRRTNHSQDLSAQISASEPPPSYDEIVFDPSPSEVSVEMNSIIRPKPYQSSSHRNEYQSQNQLNNIESASHQRFPLNLTRGRVIQHPSRRNQSSSNVILQMSNNETNSGCNEMQVSIRLREERYGNEHNQGLSRNYRIDLTDYTSPPSYAEATSAI